MSSSSIDDVTKNTFNHSHLTVTDDILTTRMSQFYIECLNRCLKIRALYHKRPGLCSFSISVSPPSSSCYAFKKGACMEGNFCLLGGITKQLKIKVMWFH